MIPSGRRPPTCKNRFNSLVLTRLFRLTAAYIFDRWCAILFNRIPAHHRSLFMPGTLMRIIYIGDVVARPGRRAVLQHVAELRSEHAADAVMMNAENVAGGFSITPPIAKELFGAGIDLMTSGNHIFDKKEVIPYIRKEARLVRPANYPPGTPGSGVFEGEIAGRRVGVVNLLGRVFMPPVDDPFRKVDECIGSLKAETKIRIVDMHCEATSEKYAMGWHCAGRVSLVVGTHTHVPTADERILEGGTAYVTDLGMTGSYAGIIGMNKSDALKRFTEMPFDRAGHAKNDIWICYIVVEVDEETGKAISIERFRKKVS